MKTKSSVCNAVKPTELLAKNEYDELGQLVKKNVGGTDLSGQPSLQKVNYNYNIRGWLKSINDIDELTPNSDPTDLFAFKINYNEVENDLNGMIEPLYNGNISETFWKTDTDNVKRNYGYQYDALNRLTNSIYQKNNSETNSYNEKISYDSNGNILTMYRTGYQDGSNSLSPYEIDKLIYSYPNNSNRLRSVYDDSQSIDGFKDGNLSNEDYKYDDFGNMTIDRNKGIDVNGQGITYNHLNLPVKILFSNDKKIEYIYNALGVKLKKVVTNIAQQDKTEYLSGFQHKNDKLEFFSTAEGYVSVTNGDKFNYVYNYTDHLGNIRVSYSLDPNDQQVKILEENHYYPFGLKHSSYNNDRVDHKRDENGGIYAILEPVDRNKNQYKYNGKEFQDELNLNWYDYHARNYDPALGRWMNVDPLAENHYENNVYMYANNNPIIYIDPDGMDFTLTGQAAQDFVSNLQRELDTADRNGSEVSIDANGGGDGDPPKIRTRTIKKLKTAEEKIDEGGGANKDIRLYVNLDDTPIGGGGALEYIGGGGVIKGGVCIIKID